MQLNQNAAPALYERAPWQVQEAPQLVRFYTHEDYDRAASEREGRPIIKAKPYIEFPRAGEIDILRREANEGDKQRFPEQWKRYQESREDVPVGTPLATLFPAHPEIISTLRFFRCHTVEQLAEMSEHGMQKIGLGAFEWRNKARELMKAADGSKGYHQLQRQLEERDATIAKLQAQMAALEVKLSQPAPQPAADMTAMVQAAVAQQLAALRGAPPVQPRDPLGPEPAPGQQIGGETRAVRQRRLAVQPPDVPGGE